MARPSVLASDADRDAVAESLHDHVAEGRISLDEFRRRLDLVYAARTYAELDRATEGLPKTRRDGSAAGRGPRGHEDRRARLERRYRRGWLRFLRVNAVVWSLWAALSLVSWHLIVLFPVVVTLPWGVARLVFAPRFRVSARS